VEQHRSPTASIMGEQREIVQKSGKESRREKRSSHEQVKRKSFTQKKKKSTFPQRTEGKKDNHLEEE